MAESIPLLRELQAVRAFVVYRLVPQADGSLDKIPIDPISGKNHTAHDPNTWLLPDEAVMWAEQYGQGFGVGVVISEECMLPNGMRLFCLDLDKCRDGERWLPHAAAFCARFPGAMVECSVSGNGLHVFGCYRGERPEHGSKNKTYRMELYTRLRFIAITGYGAQGSAMLNFTKSLHALAHEFFPPRDEVEYGDTLSECPVPEWIGPADDADLMVRMMRSGSARQIIGAKAAFGDLFYGNAAVLSRVFPPFKNTAWDESAADLALANHCAFWTGNHGVRIEGIMRSSKLVREKWDNRPEYLVNTINRACGSQRSWYKESHSSSPEIGAAVSAPQAPPASPADGVSFSPQAPPAPSNTTSTLRPTVGDYLTLTQQLGLFEGCVYVQDVHQVLMPQGYLLSSERFDTEFAGYTFAITADGSRPAKRAWDAFVHSETYQFPKVKGSFFDPRRPAHEISLQESWRYINSWVPIDIPRVQGDVTPYITHVKKILPKGQDAEILLAYFAAVVQYAGYKFQWWPLIQGVEGNGKTILSELLESAVGARYTHWPKAAELGSKFNAPFYGKILVLVEDVYISDARGSLWETLKPMITGKKLELEPKGIDKIMREVCFNGVLNTNHKNGIRKTRNDRRICPFFCAQQNESDLERDGLTEEYFNEFRAWIERGGRAMVAQFLATYEIPEKWNPVTRAVRAPKTTATEDAITAGLGVVEQEVIESIQQAAPGFRGGWVSSSALDRMLATMGKSNTIPRNKRRDLLESLGYVLHPAMPEGRAPTLDTDGSRPMLYVRPGTNGAAEVDPGRAMAWYQHAQR